jgi:hypothetical protein
MDTAIAEVIHRRPVFSFAWQKTHLYPINEAVFAKLFYKRLRFIGFVVSEVVSMKRVFHSFNAEANLLRIIGRTVPPEKIFKYIAGDVLSSLDLVKQIFTHHLTRVDGREKTIKGIKL